MQRLSPEITSDQPELLDFSTGEAELCVRAIAYYAQSSVQSLEFNWPFEARRALGYTVAEALSGTRRIAEFAAAQQALAMKFARNFADKTIDTDPHPVELTPQEIENLGYALFRLGNSGISNAHKALDSGALGHSEEGRLREVAGVQEIAGQTFALFKALEPIAKTKTGVGWMVWKGMTPTGPDATT